MKLIIALLISTNVFAMGAGSHFCEKNPGTLWCPKKPDPEPTPDPTPDPTPTPDPNAGKDEVDWKLVTKYGGTEIGIDKGIGSWPITATLRSVSIKGSMLYEDRDSFLPVPCTNDSKSLQGNFCILVKQNDGTYIAATFDYERCGGQQGGKVLDNLLNGSTMITSLNLKKGSTVCFFNSGLSRSTARNQKIRTNVVCLKGGWPY